MIDLLGPIMDYENGELTDDGVIALFSHLIRTGMAWSLQGHYGRTAAALINGGYIDQNGNILDREVD